jgi:hypothetical protein
MAGFVNKTAMKIDTKNNNNNNLKNNILMK